jgi:hypothetical protein
MTSQLTSVKSFFGKMNQNHIRLQFQKSNGNVIDKNISTSLKSLHRKYSEDTQDNYLFRNYINLSAKKLKSETQKKILSYGHNLLLLYQKPTLQIHLTAPQQQTMQVIQEHC